MRAVLTGMANLLSCTQTMADLLYVALFVVIALNVITVTIAITVAINRVDSDKRDWWLQQAFTQRKYLTLGSQQHGRTLSRLLLYSQQARGKIL